MRAVTRHAHPHRKRLELRDSLHRLDCAVALLALQPGRNVPAVIKPRVIRQTVYPHPLDRFVFRERLRDLLNLGRVLPDLRVAVHTRRSGRDTRHAGLIGSRMTIQTLNLVIARVYLVRESNWLNRLVALLIAEPTKRRALQQHDRAGDSHQQRDYLCGPQAHSLPRESGAPFRRALACGNHYLGGRGPWPRRLTSNPFAIPVPN